MLCSKFIELFLHMFMMVLIEKKVFYKDFFFQERDSELSKEAQRQEDNDKLRREFAKYANHFYKWLTDTRWGISDSYFFPCYDFSLWDTSPSKKMLVSVRFILFFYGELSHVEKSKNHLFHVGTEFLHTKFLFFCN